MKGRRKFLPSGDFGGFAEFLKSEGFGDTEYSGMMGQLGELKKAIFDRLKNVTSGKPLSLQMDPGRTDSRVDLWTQDGKLILRAQDHKREFAPDAIPWKLQVAIMFKLSQTEAQRMLVSFLLRELKKGGILDSRPRAPFRPRFGGRGGQ